MEKVKKMEQTVNDPVVEHKIDPALKARWVEALRSGNYEQTKRTLRDGRGFCCLGVLCDLIDSTKWEKDEAYGYFRYLNAKGLPPPDVEKAAGFNTISAPGSDYQFFQTPQVTINGLRTSLDDHNDAGRTFEEIAKAIEEQL
jgi:hypothetical protein